MDQAAITVIVLLILAVVIYFLPTIIAGNRNHNNTPAIVVLNVFLGWTFLGWVIALIWAFTDNTTPKNIKIYDEMGKTEPTLNNDLKSRNQPSHDG